MDPTSQFLSAGQYGAIIVVLCSIVATLFWLLIKEKDRRAEDYKVLIGMILPALKDLSAAQLTLQRSIDSIVNILERIKWKQ